MSSPRSRATGRFRRPARAHWVVGAGLAALLLPAAPAFASAPAAAADSGITAVQGATATFRVSIRDAFDEHNHLVEEVVPSLELNGKRYSVADDRLADVAPNSTLKVDGTISGDELSLSEIATVSSPAPAATPAAGGGASTTTNTTSNLVILAYWTAPDSKYTQASAQEEVANDDAWFREVSYGAVGTTATATPWVQIANPGAGCDPATVTDRARAAAVTAGYDYTQFDRTMVYFPTANCGYAGYGDLGGDWTVFNGSLSTSMTTHEQGHNLGLMHAHSYRCTDFNGNYIVMDNWCDGDEYGDPYDTMGKGGAVHYNAAYKDRLGWLSGGRRVDLGSGQSVTLAPLEVQTPGPQVAKLQVSQSRTYYVEYRQLIGFDSNLGRDVNGTHGHDGVLIHAVDSASSGYQWDSLLLDMVPDGNFYDATLKAGQSWTSPEGLTINVGALSASGAQVSVTASAPSAPRWPNAFAGEASASVSWTSPVSTGGSVVSSYTVTASPGGQSVTVPGSSTSTTVSGLTNGTEYTFTVTATNSAGTSPASAPSNAVTPLGPAQTTTHQETALVLKGWKVVSDPAATDGSYRSATAASETSSFTFTGTSVTVQARGGSAAGKAKVTIDGAAKGTVDLYRSSSTAVSLPYTGLTNKNHTIVITATGTKSSGSTGVAVGIDGYQVGSAVTGDNDPKVAYSGWAGATDASASGGAYRTSTTANTTASYTFTGTAVTWVSAKGPAYGKAQVLVDGVNRGTFDQYAAAATWQTTQAFTGLSAGQHTITIKALGTKRAASKGTAVVVDALTVTG